MFDLAIIMSNELNGPESTTSMKELIDQSNKNEKKMFKEVESQIKTQVAKSSKDNKEKEMEKENITIPKAEYDALNNKVNLLTQALRQTKTRLYGIQDAMTLVQSKVLEAKSSI